MKNRASVTSNNLSEYMKLRRKFKDIMKKNKKKCNDNNKKRVYFSDPQSTMSYYRDQVTLYKDDLSLIKLVLDGKFLTDHLEDFLNFEYKCVSKQMMYNECKNCLSNARHLSKKISEEINAEKQFENAKTEFDIIDKKIDRYITQCCKEYIENQH